MSEPDYLKFIDDAAEDLHGSLKNFEQKVVSAWTNFEGEASRLRIPYDILAADLPLEFHQLMGDFVTLLYQNDDASATPKLDCDQIREKDAAYGGSWHSRGGTGAFHALARKGDRIVSMLKKHTSLANCRKDKTNSEAIDDTLGDLRRYLILVTSWHRARQAPVAGTGAEFEIDFTVCPEPKCVLNRAHVGRHEMDDGYCSCAHHRSEHGDSGCMHRMEKRASGFLLCACNRVPLPVSLT